MAMKKEDRDRLQQLWLKLLENTSDYSGIGDGLFAEGIITRAMKERIFSKKGTDQMREILDILPKRGEKAFTVFYNVLVNREEYIAADMLCPELAAERKSKAAQGSVASGAPPDLLEDDELPTKWPVSEACLQLNVKLLTDQDTLMKAKFQKCVENKGDVYPMHRDPRGTFLIISNQNFNEAKAKGIDLKDRDGTAKDCIALTNLFRALYFKVETKVNLTAKEILQAFRNIASDVNPKDNCFACAVLTHGESGRVYGTDGETVALEKLKAVIMDECPQLIGKPKIFFIQACQGKKTDNGAARSEGTGDAKPRDERKEIENLAKNFAGINLGGETKSDVVGEGRVSNKTSVFVAMATVEGYVSWRNTTFGTWFVQAVVYIFSRFAHKYDINQLMTRVNKLVSRAETAKGLKQVSCNEGALIDDLFFFPGLKHTIVDSHSEINVAQSAGQSQETPPQTASLHSTQPTPPVQSSDVSAVPPSDASPVPPNDVSPVPPSDASAGISTQASEDEDVNIRNRDLVE